MQNIFFKDIPSTFCNNFRNKRTKDEQAWLVKYIRFSLSDGKTWLPSRMDGWSNERINEVPISRATLAFVSRDFQAFRFSFNFETRRGNGNVVFCIEGSGKWIGWFTCKVNSYYVKLIHSLFNTERLFESSPLRKEWYLLVFLCHTNTTPNTAALTNHTVIIHLSIHPIIISLHRYGCDQQHRHYTLPRSTTTQPSPSAPTPLWASGRKTREARFHTLNTLQFSPFT